MFFVVKLQVFEKRLYYILSWRRMFECFCIRYDSIFYLLYLFVTFLGSDVLTFQEVSPRLAPLSVFPCWAVGCFGFSGGMVCLVSGLCMLIVCLWRILAVSNHVASQRFRCKFTCPASMFILDASKWI